LGVLIGTVKGNGTTSSTNRYFFYDKLPSNGINYYRLEQFDSDGTFAKLGIKQLLFALPDQTTFIYPNPASKEAILRFAQGTSHIELVDLNGKIIRELKVPATATETIMPIEELPSGTYIVRMKMLSVYTARKLIKL